MIMTVFTLYKLLEKYNIKLKGLIEYSSKGCVTLYYVGNKNILKDLIYNYIPIGIKTVCLKYIPVIDWIYLRLYKKFNKSAEIRISTF